MRAASLGHALSIIRVPEDARDRDHVLDVVGTLMTSYAITKEPVARWMFADPDFLNLLSDYAEGDLKTATAMGLAIRRTVEIIEDADDRPLTALDLGSTYQAVDLATVDKVELEADILKRYDDVGLMYRGRIHWFQGESESGKSWVLLIATHQLLTAGGKVVYLDFEDHPASIKSRLIALTPEIPKSILEDRNRFAYMRPDEPLTVEAVDVLVAQMDRIKPDLVVIDGVSESMALEGLDPISTPDSAKWIALLPKRLAAHPSNPAVGVIDHQTKSTEGRKGWAFGSQHKKAGVDGAAYDVVAIRKIHRAYGGDPIEGLISVRVSKDRPGYVRGHAVDGNVAAIKITAYPDAGITYEITTDAIAQDYGLRQRIAQYLANAPGSSKRDVRDAGGKGELIDQAVAAMIRENHIRMEKEGQRNAHYLTDKGRQNYEIEEDE